MAFPSPPNQVDRRVTGPRNLRAPCTAPAAVKSSKMPNKMLIDATHPEETRVVVVRGNRVEEFDFETAQRKQLRGNIYLAKVTRVEPSLQAAFVEYGGNRHGFLAFSEIHPDYYQIPVADRQALIEDDERAHREAEEESENRLQHHHRGRSRHRNARRRGHGDRVQSDVDRQRRRRSFAGGPAPGMRERTIRTGTKACRPVKRRRTTANITPTPLHHDHEAPITKRHGRDDSHTHDHHPDHDAHGHDDHTHTAREAPVAETQSDPTAAAPVGTAELPAEHGPDERHDDATANSRTSIATSVMTPSRRAKMQPMPTMSRISSTPVTNTPPSPTTSMPPRATRPRR